jgi:oligopeptidase B
MPNAPVAEKRPHLLEQHGSTRCDDYYWMRDREDPATIAYLKAENAYLEEVLGHTAPLQQTLYEEMKARIPESDVSAPVRRGGFIYYNRMEPGKEYPIYCRKPEGEAAQEQVLLDQNALAEGQPYCGIGASEVSPDHTKLAYMLDTEGGETYTLFIKDLATGALLEERMPNTSGFAMTRVGLAWTRDGQAVYYSTLDAAHRPYRLYRHSLGTDPKQDALVYEEADATYGMYITPSRSGAYLWIGLHSTSSDEVRYLSLEQPRAEVRVVVPRRPLIEYSVEDPGDGRLFILTNSGATNFRLVSAPIADPREENWTEILPNRPDITLEEVLAFESDLVVIERKDGLRRVRISGKDGLSSVRFVEMPEAAYALNAAANPEFGTRLFRFGYTSLVTPRSAIDYDMQTGTWTTVKVDQIPSGYDPTQYATERLYATAPDGTAVPVSLVYRKDTPRDGSAPLVLYGYGSYGISMDPSFVANRLSLLDRGFIFAIGHIRGGADMGRSWYEDGKLLKKKNTFTDFIACAEHLVAQKYTSREKLAIMGGSAGGLLVGAVMTMRPDLCKAVVAQVPFVDVVTSMSDPTIPLTTFEYDQWGNPDDPVYYEYMLSYSPYDNLRPAEYPDILLTTGLNDPRVAYWEPAKFTAKMREIKTSGSLVLLHTDFGAGHGGASGRYKPLKDTARVYAFLIDRTM